VGTGDVAKGGMGKGGSLSGGGIIRDATLIAGPTASGKSALALAIAERDAGIIINADSMQVYSVLNHITARPTAADQQRAPHALYGHVHPAVAYSTGAWLRDVSRIAGEGQFAGRRPIFVGGTGLYFRALVDGISHMPAIAGSVRERWRRQLDESGPQELHRVLARDDPDAARTLKPGDGQRIVRALEVLESSGRSILEWQKGAGAPLIDRATTRFMVIEPERRWLVERIETRLARMVGEGAIDEVKALMALDLDPSLPAMKAIGVRELGMAIEGLISLAEAQRLASIATRQYAKRQSTWFRNQLGPEWQRLTSPFA
jgi:tRNA dimethylallyltransferase